MIYTTTGKQIKIHMPNETQYRFSAKQEQIDNYGVLPRAYNGSVAYISMDTNNHTAKVIKGTDSFKFGFKDPRLEGLSSPHGSLSHQNSKDFFILTKTTDTEELVLKMLKSYLKIMTSPIILYLLLRNIMLITQKVS